MAIDPRETDAHFQLGRIALDQGRLKDAFEHLQTVVNLDEKHHSHEILRELGYNEGQIEDLHKGGVV